MTPKSLCYLLATALILSLAGNAYLVLSGDRVTGAAVSPRDETHRLLSPATAVIPIDSNQESGRPILDLVNLRKTIEEVVGSYGDFEDGRFGFYVQIANVGTWVGISEKEPYMPASLLKVPIAMAVYSAIEHGHLALDQEIVVEETDIDRLAGVPDQYMVGEKKTVQSLLEAMLKVSDNTAKNVLRRQLSPQDLNSVFVHVAIPNPYTNGGGEGSSVSPRGFTRLFKALYYSTYLQRDNSQAILSLLTDTRIENLLSQSLPWEVQVAHKYGERNDTLHDCGIVYDDTNPYFICIMTRDIALDAAQAMISRVSLETYKYIRGLGGQ